MSKDACIYNKVNGTEAYLAGIVEVYTEIFLGARLNKVSKAGFCVSLISDVYGAGENNELSVQQALKKRIEEKCFDLLFDKGDIDNEVIDKLIDKIEIKKLDSDINSAIEELIKAGISNAYELKTDIERYTTSLEWYLGKPLNVYQIMDKGKLFDNYIYIPFGILIVEYEEFYMMIGIGTDD